MQAFHRPSNHLKYPLAPYLKTTKDHFLENNILIKLNSRYHSSKFQGFSLFPTYSQRVYSIER